MKDEKKHGDEKKPIDVKMTRGSVTKIIPAKDVEKKKSEGWKV